MNANFARLETSLFFATFVALLAACSAGGDDDAAYGAPDGAVGATDGSAAGTQGGAAGTQGGAGSAAGAGAAAAPADAAAGASGSEETGGSGASEAGVEAGIWGTLPGSGLMDIVGEPVQIPDGQGGTVTCYRITCNQKLLECADCEDNDGDGLIDAADPECLGPCDNTEGPVLAPGVGGETGEQCKPRDCFFDFGNGPGNDDCRWAYFCDPLEPKEGCAYDSDAFGGTDCPDGQTQLCLDMCLPITPNGCDCFGCCTFPELEGKGENGGDGYVWIGHMEEPGCTLESVTDPAACPPCTPEPSCLNPCGRCEICMGKTTIPDDCFESPPDGGTSSGGGTGGGTSTGGGSGSGGGSGTGGSGSGSGGRCAPGVQACGLPSDPACPRGTYCITGCCIVIIG